VSPPDDLPARTLLIETTTGPFFRIHAAEFDALFFDRRPTFRFNASGIGVCYAGLEPAAAFIETFGRSLPAQANDRVLTTRSLLNRRMTTIAASRPLALADLTGPGLSRIGATTELSAMPDYARTQEWALALANHPASVDGLLYRARFDPSVRSIALFDRCSAALSVVDSVNLLVYPALAALLDRYDFGLA
jgi:hypothetical protein